MSSRVTQTIVANCPKTAATPVDAETTCGPTDPRCNDSEFAFRNPDLCGDGQLLLGLRPEVATLNTGLTLQYSTYIRIKGVDTTLTQGISYASSNISVVTINSSTGLATAVSAGPATITVTWHGITATAQLTVASDCGTAAIVIAIDDSLSMSQPFGGGGGGGGGGSTNNGLCGATLLAETFEGGNGSGYDLPDWVETGTVDPNYASSPLQGTQSFRVHTDSSNAVHQFDAPVPESCIRFKVKPATLPASDVTILGFDGIAFLHLDNLGRLRVEYPGSAFTPWTVGTMSAGSTYCVKLHYKNDGSADVEFQTTYAFTGSGNNHTSLTGGDTGFDVTGIILGNVGGADSSDIIIDDITVTDFSGGGVTLLSGGGNTAYDTRLDFAKAAATKIVTDTDLTNVNIGIVRFNTAVLSQALSMSESILTNYIGLTPQSHADTTIGEALQAASDMLAATSATHKAIILISDGEQRVPSGSSTTALDPATVALAFQNSGGILVTCGVRASGDGFTLLQSIGTGGFFLNALPTNVADVLALLSGLRGYFCAGSCTEGLNTVGCLSVPPGDQIQDPSPLGDLETDGTGGGGGSWTETASCTKSCPPGSIGDPVTRVATYTSTISQADAATHAQQQACADASAALSCCLNGPIAINDATNAGVTAATPYPACYRVSGFGSTIASMTVRIYGFSHVSPRDVKMLLVAPDDVTSVLLFQHCGTSNGGGATPQPCVNVNLVFQDGATVIPGGVFPAAGNPIPSGTYRPTEYDGAIAFPPPAPIKTPYPLLLSTFNGMDPNGLWKLYITDDVGLDIGSVVSWDLVLNGTEPGCHCTDDTVIRINNYATVLSNLTICSQCATVGAGTQWDGTLTQTGAGVCSWTANGVSFPRIGTSTSFKYAIIEFLSLPNGQCIYELRIYCVINTSLGGGLLIWAGQRADSLSPTGTYTRTSTPTGTQTPCSPGPPTIDVVT